MTVQLRAELLDGFRPLTLSKMAAKLSSRWNDDPVSLYMRKHNVVAVTRINLSKTSVNKMQNLILSANKPVEIPMKR